MSAGVEPAIEGSMKRIGVLDLYHWDWRLAPRYKKVDEANFCEREERIKKPATHPRGRGTSCSILHSAEQAYPISIGGDGLLSADSDRPRCASEPETGG